jgi:hypothetical protein
MDILKDSEREYLRSIVLPFYDDVEYVVKKRNCHTGISFINIFIGKRNNSELSPYFCIPYLENDGLYCNMVYGKGYSLKELGIFK